MSHNLVFVSEAEGGSIHRRGVFGIALPVDFESFSM